MAVSESSSHPASVVWHHGCSGNLHKIRCDPLDECSFSSEPLAEDHQDISPICSDAQDLQRAFPATIQTYSDELAHLFLSRKQAQIIKTAPYSQFSEQKEPTLKLVLLGHCLEGLNNLKSRNVLNTLGYVFSLLTVISSESSVKTWFTP